MSQVPVLQYVFDRHKRATATKPGSVELRITFERKAKFITTGVRCLPKQWRNGTVVGSIDANQTLNIIYMNAHKIINDMMEEGQLCLDEVAERMKERQEKPKVKYSRTFMAFCEERSEVRKYGKSEDSQERYDRFMRFFRSWGKIVAFDDITEANIIRLDKYLNDQGFKPYSIWQNYHRFLNSFILDAIDEGIIRRNPYKHVRINKDKSSGGLGKYLTAEEFHKIERMKLPTKSLERVRDLFVFQTYTCLSYVDLTAFDVNDVKKVNGHDAYVGNRGKTGQEYVFVLMPGAKAVLNKYGGQLPMLSNVKYNAYLKALAQHAGIDKPISSHWARHTGATMLLNMGVNMEIVAKILGHSSTNITRQVYAKLLDETVVDAMAKIKL